MTCRRARRLLGHEALRDDHPIENRSLTAHLEACRRCNTVRKAARLSSVLLNALRQEINPGPSFYPRLRERFPATGIGQADIVLLQAWEFARRLVPALALGVVLLAGMTITSGGPRSPLRDRMRRGADVPSFSLDELNLPAAERPTHDQMLAFVLMRGTGLDVPDAR